MQNFGLKNVYLLNKSLNPKLSGNCLYLTNRSGSPRAKRIELCSENQGTGRLCEQFLKSNILFLHL